MSAPPNEPRRMTCDEYLAFDQVYRAVALPARPPLRRVREALVPEAA